jgi:cytochrome c peroxidase
MMAALGAMFPADQLRIVLGPESFSPKLESISLTSTASEIKAMAGSTENAHLVKELILIGDAKIVEQARRMAEQLDRHRAQVRLKVKIIDIDFDALHQLGVSYDFSAYSFRETTNDPTASGAIKGLSVGQIAHLPLSLDATVTALEKHNQSRTLAEPTVSILDGERGFILIGDRILFPKLTGYTQAQTPIYDKEEVRVGIYVQVSVEMAGHGDLILAVYPQVSTVSGYLTVNGASYPQISTREEQTTVRLHEGTTLVIGGLISNAEVKNLQQIPGLGRIPFLGEFFRSRNNTNSKKDLVIMITPEILEDGDTEVVHHGEAGDKHLAASTMPPPRPFFPASAPEPPLGLPPLPWPATNPYSRAKAELGWLLFYDKRLSSDGSVSCADCHRPDAAFADRRERAMGIGNLPGRRNSLSIINAAYYSKLLWDGSSDSLEAQAKQAIANPAEMDMHEAKILKTIRSIPEYRTRFREAFGNGQGTLDQIVQAIATFERLVVSGNSPYDRYIAGDRAALTATQQRGLAVFTKQCASCHTPPLFTNGSYIRIGFGKRGVDDGREEFTGQAPDRGAFRVPTLREAAYTAPYMHDGSVTNLEEVVHLYLMGTESTDSRLRSLRLTGTDIPDLLEFIPALNGEGWQRYVAPISR